MLVEQFSSTLIECWRRLSFTETSPQPCDRVRRALPGPGPAIWTAWSFSSAIKQEHHLLCLARLQNGPTGVISEELKQAGHLWSLKWLKLSNDSQFRTKVTMARHLILVITYPLVITNKRLTFIGDWFLWGNSLSTNIFKRRWTYSLKKAFT